ncbi:MAG: hypothetical protein P4L85_14190 [Paludisphaera borealis]|uniref:hypothetical protein n=1 Tax=Paludisphaera borealis TaxID=1387353 RepID=UPI00284AD465|nr:hypothetical protein [Paludisphaera borealis]MDR3620496.1 hypothetical protein [Paludisphaera borealis]
MVIELTKEELKPYVEAAGGKRPFAHRVDISERYAEMLMKGERVASKRLSADIKRKIKLKPQPKDPAA